MIMVYIRPIANKKIAVEALLGGFNLIGNLTCELSKSWSSASSNCTFVGT